MKRRIFSIIGVIIITLIILFIVGNTSPQDDELKTDQQLEFYEEKLNILSFNIQVYGVTKASKPEVMEILADIIMQYDMVAIQEVRDSSGVSVPMLMKLLPPTYTYLLGPREGRSSSKEQYLFIWDSRKFNLLDYWAYPDMNDWFERNPLAVYFETYNDGFDFVVINNHIAPREANIEIPHLLDVVNDVEAHFTESDIIILGDMNADGHYFNEKALQSTFPSYDILIPNNADTTVAPSENTYDRIIVTPSLREDYTGRWGVYYFDSIYDFETLTIEPKEVSDHYPVWIEVYNDYDTD